MLCQENQLRQENLSRDNLQEYHDQGEFYTRRFTGKDNYFFRKLKKKKKTTKANYKTCN